MTKVTGNQGTVTLLMVAAGSGVRMGAKCAKAWIEIDGRPILRHALGRASSCREIDSMIVLVPKGDLDKTRGVLREWDLPGKIEVLEGGARRQDTVRIGIEALPGDCGIVVVHDAARPFASGELFARVIGAARDAGAATASVSPVDTIVAVDKEGEPDYLDRAKLRAIQTPQAFRREIIVEAHRMAVELNIEATDDASLVRMAGSSVRLVEGESTNFKITYPEDIDRALNISRKMR